MSTIKIILQRFVGTIVILGQLSGCGYFTDEPVKESVVDARNLVGTCSIDVEKLKKIITESIPEEINCLEKNIEKYQELVERENQSSIGKNDLKEFVKVYFSSDAGDLNDAIDLAFLVNAIVLNDSNDSILVSNLAPFFQVLRIFNRTLVNLNEIIDSYDDGQRRLIDSRQRVRQELLDFSKKLRPIIITRGVNSDAQFNIFGFVQNLQTNFNVLNYDTSVIRSVLALKKLMLGGKEDILTRPELFEGLEKLPDLGKVVFSIIKGEEASFVDRNDYLLMLREGLETLELQLFPHVRSTVILNNELLKGLIEFFAKDEDVERYYDLATILRKNILNEGAQNDHIDYRDIKNIFLFGKSALDGYIFYKKYQDVVENKDSWTSEDWQQARRKLVAEFELFREKTIESLNTAFFLPHKFFIYDFLSEVKDKSLGLNIENKYVELLRVAKVLVVSGEETVLTRPELTEFIHKSDTIANRTFDLLLAKKEFYSERERRKLYYEMSLDGFKVLTTNGEKFVSKMGTLLDKVGEFFDNNEFKTFEPALEKLKKRLFGGDGDTLRVKDFRELLTMVKDYFAVVYYTDITYDLNEKQLSYKKKLFNIEFEKSPLYKIFSEEQKADLEDRFKKIALNYRIYRTKDGFQEYNNGYNRTKYGMIELSYLRYFLERLARAFGTVDSKTNRYSVTMSGLNTAMLELKPVLEYVGLWSNNQETFARNVVLLADLFQGQSDGTVSVDVDEATEFGGLVLFAMKAADEVYERMANYCDEFSVSDLVGYKISCYREKFYKVFFSDLGYKVPLKRFADYVYDISSKSSSKLFEFHTSVEGFARDYDDPRLPMTKRDLTLLIGAFLNIESAYIRFDQDLDNHLSHEELKVAFPIYEEALIDIGDLEGKRRKFAKAAFFYVIDKKKMPNTEDIIGLTGFGAYHFANAFEGVEAERLNIGVLLYNMVKAANEDVDSAVVKKKMERLKRYQSLL